MSKTGLQTINHQNELATWSDQIADCRSSGQTVSQWCAEHGIPTSTYYNRQRRVFEMASKASGAFVEVPMEPQLEKGNCVATVSAGGLTAEIYAGADEVTMAALFRAMKLC